MMLDKALKMIKSIKRLVYPNIYSTIGDTCVCRDIYETLIREKLLPDYMRDELETHYKLIYQIMKRDDEVYTFNIQDDEKFTLSQDRNHEIKNAIRYLNLHNKEAFK